MISCWSKRRVLNKSYWAWKDTGEPVCDKALPAPIEHVVRAYGCTMEDVVLIPDFKHQVWDGLNWITEYWSSYSGSEDD